MFYRMSLYAVAALILLPWTAVAQTGRVAVAKPALAAPAAHELSSQSSRKSSSSASSRKRTLQTRPVSRTYEEQRPLGGTVGPDNYQYFHQACCL